MALIFGGSFDPPHLGHFRLIKYALDSYPVEKLYIIPNNQNPWKKPKTISNEKLLSYLHLWTTILPNSIVWNYEIESNETSYTINTLLNFKERFPDEKIYYLVGEDQLDKLQKYYSFNEILNLVNHWVVFRRTTQFPNKLKEDQKLPMKKQTMTLLDNPIWSESSTIEREKDYLPLIEFFKKQVKTEVSKSRFEHILRVARYAEELAKDHFYPNPDKAILASLLHDITKQKSNEFHLKYTKNLQLPENLPKEALHSYSASVYLKETFDFFDSEIQSAIESHTLGSFNLFPLDLILASADFLGSEYAQGLEEFSKLLAEAKANLWKGCWNKFYNSSKILENKGHVVHPITTKFLSECNNRKNAMRIEVDSE